MTSLEATCPAASPIAGAYPAELTIICGVLANDRDEEGQGRDKGVLQNVTFTLRKDPSTVLDACCGNYQKCGIWQAERNRLDELKKRLEPNG